VHSVDELFALVVGTGDDDARWSAIQELHALGSREVFERALQLCASATASERVAGADILGQLHSFSDAAAGTLIALLGDCDPAVVEAAVHALAQRRDSETLDALTRLSAHEVANVRWALATALEDVITDERAERVLLKLMRDEDSSVRDHATFAIGSLSDHDAPRIRTALAERLLDDDRSVSHEAALGLARRRDSRAISYIAAAIESEDAEIVEAADEITSAEMLPELLKARDSLGETPGLLRLIERCRARL
jgi:HEAT repeat protein